MKGMLTFRSGLDDGSVRRMLLGVFCLSGFSGLIYESLWAHYLKLFLGHAAYAQTLVLAIFMGGMALGSWLCSRYSGRWKNLLAAYALAEAAVGLCALLFHGVFDRLVTLSYVSVIPALSTPMAVSLYKWVLAGLLIIPQSVLLGMTFPLMAAGLIREYPEQPGGSVALVYFSNSIGAAAGVLVSGFLLIRLAGLPGTMRLAGFINIVLACVVWILVKGRTAANRPAADRSGASGASSDRGLPLLLLAASFFTGVASFIYEMGWIRMLSLVMGSSTHAFELMLSAFILGLALGGLWIQRRIDRGDATAFLAFVQLVMGLCALSTLLIYGKTFEVMRWLLGVLQRDDSGYVLFNVASNGIALAVMLPTTFCAGMTLPLITGALLKRGFGERSIGAVYAANTVGAIAGVFFSIHAGLPILGLKGLITFGAGVDMAVGVALLWAVSLRSGYAYRAAAAGTVCIVAVAAVLAFVRLDQHKMASGVYRTGQLLTRDDVQIAFQRDGKTSSVSIMVAPDGMTAITTNGKVDAAINLGQGMASPDEATMVLAAAIPMGYHPGARTVANIGLGSGLTTHTLLGNPKLERVDTIEIEQSIIDAARHFGPAVSRAYDDPRSRMYVDDAKTFFSSHKGRYDIIISEPSNPWVSGVSGLFSDEFYRMARRHLNPGGLFVQWIQLYEIDLPLVASVLKAVSRNFDDYVAYATTGVNLVVVAGNDGSLKSIDPAIFQMEGLANSLRRVQVEGIQDIELRGVGGKAVLDDLIGTFAVPANSDYRPFLDQNASRTQFLQAYAHDLLTISHSILPVLDMLDRRSARRETHVTFSPYYPKTQAAKAAEWMRDMIVKGTETADGSVSPGFRKQAGRFRELMRTCGKGTRAGEFPADVLDISVIALPNLVPAEAEALLNASLPESCLSGMTSEQKTWMSLLHAVARRDAETMASAAPVLLDGGGRLTPHAERYLLAAGMLGRRAKGDLAGARVLWDRYRKRVFGEKEPELIFRLLSAGSGA